MYIYRHDTAQIGQLELKIKTGENIASDMIRSYYHTGDKRITFNAHMNMFECSEHDYQEIASLFYHIEFLSASFDALGWTPADQGDFMQQFDHLSLWDGYYAAVNAMCELID